MAWTAPEGVSAISNPSASTGTPAARADASVSRSGTFCIEGTPPLAFTAGDVLLFHGDQPVAGGTVVMPAAGCAASTCVCRTTGSAGSVPPPMLILAEAIFARSTRPATERRLLRMAHGIAAEGSLMRGATATEAAVRVGYTNMRHFARIFRECYGCNPSLFRARRGSDSTVPGTPC